MKEIKKYKKTIGLSVIIILSAGFIFYFYGKVILSPNKYLFTESGDAIKNYYTYAYHNVNDTSALNFEGLNYPYGENFLYTDCHPAFTLIIRTIKPYFPNVINYQIGIINFLMIFSILLSAIFVWLILIKYKVNEIYAVLPAIGIMIMQPQLFRLLGHLALSYAFFIPLTWLLLLKYREGKKKLFWSVIIGFNNIFLFFVHGYLGMIASAFLISYYFFDIIFNFKKTYKAKINYLYIFIQSLFPMLFFRYFIAYTDMHVGRTDNPWGFFSYRADWDTVFIAHHPPLNPLWHKIINLHQSWEGWAYIGISSITAIIILIIRTYKTSETQKQFSPDKIFFPEKHLRYIFYASIITLLFSMALPFRAGLRFLVDWFPLIKQFRSVGRFAWIFYYVITILSSIYFFNLGKYFLTKNKKILAVIIFMLPALYIIEGIPYHQTTYKKLTQSTNLFDFKQLDHNFKEVIDTINAKDYQAIFPIPFYYINSDYGKAGTDKIYKTSMVFSYHLNLPIQGSYLGRTGIYEAKKIKQLLSPGYYPKLIQNEIPSGKPWLMIYTKENIDKYEKRILNMGKKLYENKEFALYSLSPDSVFKDERNDAIKNFEKIKDNLISKDNFLITDTNSYFFFNDFESTPDSLSFLGKGAFSADKVKYSVLAEIPPNSLIPDEEYTVSFWMYNWGRNFGQGVLNSSLFIEGKNKDGSLFRIAEKNPTQSCVIFDKYSLIELNFKTSKIDVPYKLIIKGGNNPAVKIHIDNLILKKSNNDVYKILKKSNNQIIKLLMNNNIICLNETE